MIGDSHIGDLGNQTLGVVDSFIVFEIPHLTIYQYLRPLQRYTRRRYMMDDSSFQSIDSRRRLGFPDVRSNLRLDPLPKLQRVSTTDT